MGATLDDTEKFKMVFEESGLNQTRFSEKIGITPGSLSGILNGRTKPTMALFRNLVQAFPNINPMWLFADDENMHVGDTSVSSSSATSSTLSSDESFDSPSLDDMSFDFGELGKSAAMAAMQTAPKTPQSVAKNVSPVEPVRNVAPVEQKPRVRPVTPPPTAPVIPNEYVAAMAMTTQKPPRQITEIRIFFDDGTYETFGPR